MKTKLALISIAAVAALSSTHATAGELYQELGNQTRQSTKSASSLEPINELGNRNGYGEGELHQAAEVALENARGTKAVKAPYVSPLAVGGELGGHPTESDGLFGKRSVFAE